MPNRIKYSGFLAREASVSGSRNSAHKCQATSTTRSVRAVRTTQVDVVGGLDLLSSAVTNEERLATPLNNDGLTLSESAQIDLHVHRVSHVV